MNFSIELNWIEKCFICSMFWSLILLIVVYLDTVLTVIFMVFTPVYMFMLGYNTVLEYGKRVRELEPYWTTTDTIKNKIAKAIWHERICNLGNCLIEHCAYQENEDSLTFLIDGEQYEILVRVVE